MDSPKTPSCHSCPNAASDEMSRRTFLQMAAAGLGVVLLAGCSDSETPAGPPAAGGGAVSANANGKELTIPGAGKLQNGQGMAYSLNGETHGIVFKTATGELKAVTARCTHSGGTLEWQNGHLHCPSHNSQFDTEGKVTAGPATKPLNFFKVKQAGDDAVVQIA